MFKTDDYRVPPPESPSSGALDAHPLAVHGSYDSSIARASSFDTCSNDR